MKIKNLDVQIFIDSLNPITKTYIGATNTKKVINLKKQLIDLLKDIDDARIKLCELYSNKDKDGKAIQKQTENGFVYDIAEKTSQKFYIEFHNLGLVESEVNVEKLNMQELNRYVKLSADEVLMFIDYGIIELEDEEKAIKEKVMPIKKKKK